MADLVQRARAVLRKLDDAEARKAGAKHRLTRIAVDELSLVDHGANRRTWSVLKRGGAFAEVLKRAEVARDDLRRQLSGSTREARIVKAEQTGEQRYAMGVVLEPEVVDAQGDVYDAAAIRSAAHDYLAKARNVGLQHERLINDRATLVESYLAPVDMTIGDTKVKAGTWLAAFRIHDPDLWAAVKSGKLSGISIGGRASKRPIAKSASLALERLDDLRAVEDAEAMRDGLVAWLLTTLRALGAEAPEVRPSAPPPVAEQRDVMDRARDVLGRYLAQTGSPHITPTLRTLLAAGASNRLRTLLLEVAR